MAEFFDDVMELGVEGISLSPGYSYSRAPRQDVFLDRRETKGLFREIFERGRHSKRRWRFNQSPLFLDFLAGNQSYECTPWSTPTYNLFGWQRPCYLLEDEGHTDSFQQLLDQTAWNRYGAGRNPKCDNCMAHCGYEGTAVGDTVSHPLKALRVALFGPRTRGPMVPDPPKQYADEPLGDLEIPAKKAV